MIAAPQINPQAISIWLAKYLIDAGRARIRAQRFLKEQELEQFRSVQHPGAVSRLTGLYLFPTLEAAKMAEDRWDASFRPENLTEVEIVSVLRQSRYDAEWITHHLDSSDNSWFDSYFSGFACGVNPTWELLVEGRAFILSTDLRSRAYDVIAKAWPQSLALLELSRIAVVLDSDLGVICPIAVRNGNKLRIDIMLNFEDATNEAFLKKVQQYEGPKNTKDLYPFTIVTPNLARYSTELIL
jgi:hypothetical protein